LGLGLLTKLSFTILVNTFSRLNQTCLEAFFFCEPHSEQDTNMDMNIYFPNNRTPSLALTASLGLRV